MTEIGYTVTHRRYVSHADAHYGGDLVDGAYTLALFGDAATDLTIHTDNDEGLLAGYTDIKFLAPVRAGDILEITATLTRIGTRSRDLTFTARILARATPSRGPSAAEVLDPPVTATTAGGTVVVSGGLSGGDE
jgi:3-aminobutyryl-CoA ammonia-lyase